MSLEAQQTFSDSSRLANPGYLEDRIRKISDADLFSALDLSAPSLRPVAAALHAGDTLGAYRAWGRTWEASHMPRYAFKAYRMQVNTETLTGYDDVRRSLPGGSPERIEVLARADSIRRHVIPVWGDQVERFGTMVDFNRDVGRSGKYGFHYWIWSHALTAAYLVTGDEGYLDTFQSLFLQWYDQRNAITGGFPGLDIVYYELGLGVRTRFFIEYYLIPHSAREVRTHERLLKTFLAAGRWLEQLERWEGYRPGNWQIHGSYMLCQLALTVPQFRESASWAEIGLRRMEEHLDRDFFSDGGHYERCPNNYTLSMHNLYRNLDFLLQAHRRDLLFRGRLRASLAATVDWFVTVVSPTGMFPAVNDSHRGLIPPPTLEEGGIQYDRPHALGVLSRLFGDTKYDDAPLPSWTSRTLAPSGFTVFRSDWSRDALYMVVNHGPYGGNHTHHDVLSFEMYAYGRALAVDAGIGATYDDTLYVPWYKSSRAHCTVVLNDSNIVREGVTGENVEWGQTSVLEYWAASHEGYAHRGAAARRRIAFVPPFYWLVLDEMACRTGGDTLSWVMLTPDAVAPVEGGFRSRTAPGIDLRCLETVVPAPVEQVWAASPTAVQPGKTARVNRVALQKAAVAGSTVRFPVLLYPFRIPGDSVRAARLSEKSFVVHRNGVTDVLCFADGAHDDGVIATDASCAMVRQTAKGDLMWAVAGGTYLRHHGRLLWQSGKRTTAEGSLEP